MSFALVRVKCAYNLQEKYQCFFSTKARFHLVFKSFLIIKVKGTKYVLFTCVMTEGILIQICLCK